MSASDAQRASALFTDLYELTMLQAFVAEDMHEEAVFTLSARALPDARNYLIACGIETVLDDLAALAFTPAEIEYLASLGRFSEPFLQWLATLRFTGSVRAVPEGTPVFGDTPILEVSAPLPQAQLVETLLLNRIHTQTLLATKARRIVHAAQGRPVLDFGARRAHGIDAATDGARAFAIGGVAATSNLLAGQRHGLPVAGTMAHSYVQAHASERAAFAAFARQYPDTVLLVDTYDTLGGVQEVIRLARRLGEAFAVRGLRLDSGDFFDLVPRVRRMLDDAGLEKLEIVVSGGLDEYRISELLAAGAPVDRFGVGSEMAVSRDAPSLELVYKLCAYAGRDRMKLSTGKPVLPGPKQVFRVSEGDTDVRDIIATAEESMPGRPLLSTVMRDGRRVADAGPTLDALRAQAETAFRRLPPAVQALDGAAYPVAVSDQLIERQAVLEADIRRTALAENPDEASLSH